MSNTTIIIEILSVIIIAQAIGFYQLTKELHRVSQNYMLLAEKRRGLERIIDWCKHHGNVDMIITIEQMEKKL